MADWNPNDPVLTSPRAAHETAAVMRWHRAHVPSKEIMQLLRLRGTQLVKKLEQAWVEEQKASAKGLDIHDALIHKETS
jgi:hypothetical protein